MMNRSGERLTAITFCQPASGTSSGAFGYTVGTPVAMGYVKLAKEDWKQWLTNGAYEIEIAGSRFGAVCAQTPFYDPQNTRVKA